MTMLVAQVSVATGISPVDLLNTPQDVFMAIIAVLKQQARQNAKR